jgi:hypothetical protein
VLPRAPDGQFDEGVGKKRVGASTEIRVAPQKPFASLFEKYDASDQEIE